MRAAIDETINPGLVLDFETDLDDTPEAYTTMWVVRVDDELYVRSAGGPNRPWYRRAKHSGGGRIRARGADADVTFADANDDAQAAIDAAYHSKYESYGPEIVGSVVGSHAHRVTVRLVQDGPR